MSSKSKRNGKPKCYGHGPTKQCDGWDKCTSLNIFRTANANKDKRIGELEALAANMLLDFATVEGMNAQMLRKWRYELQANNIDLRTFRAERYEQLGRV